MHIAYLADHPEYLTLLTQWFYEEWSYLNPGKTEEDLRHKLIQRLNTHCFPLTLLALDGQECLGTSSLIFHDMDTHLHLSPWLSSMYVPPNKRNLGIGTHLLKSSLRKAKELGCSKLYLYTPRQSAWCEKFGWTPIERTHYREEKVTVMEINLID